MRERVLGTREVNVDNIKLYFSRWRLSLDDRPKETDQRLFIRTVIGSKNVYIL